MSSYSRMVHSDFIGRQLLTLVFHNNFAPGKDMSTYRWSVVIAKISDSDEVRWMHHTGELLGRLRTPVREAFSYGIRHISLWFRFNEVWLYASLDPNEICRSRMKMPHVQESATSLLTRFSFTRLRQCECLRQCKDRHCHEKLLSMLRQWNVCVLHKHHPHKTKPRYYLRNFTQQEMT